MFGNFVNRILEVLRQSRFDGLIPAGGEPEPLEQRLYERISAGVVELT